ncbi:putative FAS1 domain-containing protein [Dioscorea sansibarensis]
MERRKHRGVFSLVFMLLLIIIPCLCLLILLSLSLPEIATQEKSINGFYRKVMAGTGRKRAASEVSLCVLGDIMVSMLPSDLAFTVFVPSEAAFESILKLRASESLTKEKINNTYALLSRVMAFSAVPQHLPSASLPFNGEVSFDSVSGFRLHAWRSLDKTLLVNNVTSERVDLKKDEIIVHVISGVLMDAEFEQSII